MYSDRHFLKFLDLLRLLFSFALAKSSNYSSNSSCLNKVPPTEPVLVESWCSFMLSGLIISVCHNKEGEHTCTVLFTVLFSIENFQRLKLPIRSSMFFILCTLYSVVFCLLKLECREKTSFIDSLINYFRYINNMECLSSTAKQNSKSYNESNRC